MNTITKLIVTVLLGSAVLLTGCDPSGVSGTDQSLKETNLSPLVSSSQMNATATEYEIVDLGTLDGGFSTAFGINEHGQVVGFSRRAEGEARTFLWDEVGGMQDLGTFGGVNSAAYDINDGGEIVGLITTATGLRQPIIWDEENGVRHIGLQDEINSFPSSINNLGEVAFYKQFPTRFEAYLWDEINGEQYLGTLGGNSSAPWGINDARQVVGNSETSSGEFHAFIWDEVGGMQDLGTLGGIISAARDINNKGQVVGNSETSSGERHAFIWDEASGMRDLGTLGGVKSNAEGINDAGQVVGSSTNSSGELHAFIWDEVRGMQDLGKMVGGASSATSINNMGQIVGSLTDTSKPSERRATLWNPVQNSDTTPPELTFETVSTNLWPPNHKMHLVLSGISATDDSDEDPSLTVSVTSNEMLNGLGDGNTDEDWQVVQVPDGSYEVYVRAERSGNGSGRIYTVTMTAEDASGNVAEEIIEVQVARDMSRSLN